MASEKKIGRMERVELRELWENEASDFTPWLAREDNIVLLGDAIGIDLEVDAQEQEVGPYRADILCKDTANDQWVLIENQLERTDHRHLGQLLTYAAGLNAVTLVWISDKFTDEHRAALDWLNERISDEVRFFGIEIELWRIGESPIAPKFNVVSKPNNWTRQEARRRPSRNLTEGQKLLFEYWREFRKVMEERGGTVKPANPTPNIERYFPLGKTGFSLYAAAVRSIGRIDVGLFIRGSDAKRRYNELASEKDEIEREAGERFSWEERPDKAGCVVALRREDCDLWDRAGWPEQHDWLYEKLQLFHKTFAARVKRLDAADR